MMQRPICAVYLQELLKRAKPDIAAWLSTDMLQDGNTPRQDKRLTSRPAWIGWMLGDYQVVPSVLRPRW